MTDDVRRDDSSTELVDVIRQVRRRWRMKLALARRARRRSGSACSSCCCRPTGSSRGGSRRRRSSRSGIILGLALAGLVGYLLVRPLMRNATDEQVALYLEEHEPSLQAAIISAVEAEPRPGAQLALLGVARAPAGASRRSRNASEIEGGRARRAACRCAATALTLAAIARRGDRALRARPGIPAARAVGAVRSCRATSRPPRRIASRSRPATRRCRSGADQTITATAVRLRRRPGVADDHARRPTPPFERVPLLRGDDGKYEGMLFDLAGPVEYFVEANGVRSASLHAEGRRPAVRAAARARVSLPGVHRAAAAEGRRRRRHRGAQGHRSARACGPDDERAGRRRSCSRQERGRRCRRRPRADRRRR